MDVAFMDVAFMDVAFMDVAFMDVALMDVAFMDVALMDVALMDVAFIYEEGASKNNLPQGLAWRTLKETKRNFDVLPDRGFDQ
jgi:hypothetical protein